MSVVERLFEARDGTSFQTKGYTGYKTAWDSHPFTDWKTISSVSYMESVNHGWNPNQGFHGDVGGPWLKEDVILGVVPTVLQQFGLVASGGYGHCQQKAYTANPAAVALSNRTAPTTADEAKAFCEGYTGGMDTSGMISKGSTAIARCEPTNPASDMSTAILELIHDGKPSMPGRTEGNIGDEYLNLQFGWSPTIGDGRDFIRAIRKQGDIQYQYARDSGRLVRRRYEFPRSSSSSTVTQSGVYPAYWDGPTADVVGTGTRVTTTRTEQRIWFSGAFTYHIPHNAFGRTIYNLDRKYGLVPGLDTAWELTPYSWLVDWFSNAGDVIHNLNAFTENGLVMAYGYVMQEDVTVVDCSWTGNLSDNFASTKHRYTLTDSITYRKRARVQATPYGFGLNWDGFNPFQLSILAALGISRAF
jgi:hypothetical protein